MAPRRFSQISGAPKPGEKEEGRSEDAKRSEISIEREGDERKSGETRERAERRPEGGERVLAALWRAPRVAPRRFGASDAETLH